MEYKIEELTKEGSYYIGGQSYSLGPRKTDACRVEFYLKS